MSESESLMNTKLTQLIRTRCNLSGESYQSTLRRVQAGEVPLNVPIPSEAQQFIEHVTFCALTSRANYHRSPVGIRRFIGGADDSWPIVELDPLEMGHREIRTRIRQTLVDLLPYSETANGTVEGGVSGLVVQSIDGRDLTIGLRSVPMVGLIIRSTQSSWMTAVHDYTVELHGYGYFPAWDTHRPAPSSFSRHHEADHARFGSPLLRAVGAMRLTQAYCGNSWGDPSALKLEFLITPSHRNGHHDTFLSAITTANSDLTCRITTCACGREVGSCIAVLSSATAPSEKLEIRFSRGLKPSTEAREFLHRMHRAHVAKRVLDAHGCPCLLPDLGL